MTVLHDLERRTTSLGAIARMALLLGALNSTSALVWWLRLPPTWCASGDCAGGIADASYCCPDRGAFRGVEGQADKVTINKGRRELILLRHGATIRTYRVALGRNPVGAKQRHGDGKTPEGSYTIAGRNPNSAFHKSLRISYPSAADRERARRAGVSPGGEIMIHGLPNGRGWIGAKHRLMDWTEGCVAVTDEEIEEIWGLVPDGTPIQINP